MSKMSAYPDLNKKVFTARPNFEPPIWPEPLTLEKLQEIKEYLKTQTQCDTVMLNGKKYYLLSLKEPQNEP